MLFNVCSAVTVECCVCTHVAWVCLVSLLLCKEEGSSPVSAITERRHMGLYEVPLSMSGFVMGTMLANLHMCGIMLLSATLAQWGERSPLERTVLGSNPGRPDK